MEKKCQLSIYGGNPEWQRLGLQEYPATNWLILITSNDKKNNVRFLDQAVILKNDLEKEQADFPDKYKKKISILDVSELSEDYYRLMGRLVALYELIKEKNYKITVNATSGLQLIKLVLYQVSLINKDIVDDYFIFNRQNGIKQVIWIQKELDENEEIIIEILNNLDWINISKLTDLFNKNTGKGKISYITKIIQKMSEAGLIEEKKEGRDKNIRISSISKSLIGESPNNVELL